MLKCPGGRIKVGYENNPPNRFLETDNLTFQNNAYPVSQNLSLSRKILNDSTSTPYLIKDELSKRDKRSPRRRSKRQYDRSSSQRKQKNICKKYTF